MQIQPMPHSIPIRHIPISIPVQSIRITNRNMVGYNATNENAVRRVRRGSDAGGCMRSGEGRSGGRWWGGGGGGGGRGRRRGVGDRGSREAAWA